MQSRTIPGATAALLVSHRQDSRHSFDLVATQPLESGVRGITCHVPWFEDADRMAVLENTCVRAMTMLLERSPAGRKLTSDCKRATHQLGTLRGPTDPASGSPELRAEVSDFANRCTDKVAACALAASNFVEATLCRD